MNNKALILLSGGLDSLVSLDMIKNDYNVVKSLTFNYGQKAFEEEKEASLLISKYYKIENEIIELPFLKKISQNALTQTDNNNFTDINELWIPNRNSLFLNIAAVYCDKYNINYIIFGANKEEARKFPDNTKEFVININKTFEFSTINKPKVLAPCIEFDKIQILDYAIDNDVPLKFLKSCYDSKKHSNKKHCGKCMSCQLLYNAILKSKKPELIKEIF